MKKFLMFLVTSLLLMFSFSSCTTTNSTDAQMGIVYNVNIDGDADGSVDVTFPNGNLNLTGAATIDFIYSNDTSAVFKFGQVMTAEEIMVSNDANKIEALNYVNSCIDNSFTVNAAEAGGTYDIVIKGYVKETLTGIIIAIDRRFTNR